MEWESDNPCHSFHMPERNAGPQEGAASEGWSVRIVEQSHCWLWRDGLRGHEGGDCGGKCQWKKGRQPWKQGNTAKSCVRGEAITVGSLSPHISSWTIETLAHQAPDAQNNRVGPHPGWCFKRQRHQTTEENPREGSLLSAWTSGANGERLAKEAFWSPAARGLKTDW